MENIINPKQRDPFILVIEGVDFSGKTTLAHQIQSSLIEQSYRVKLLHDPKGSKNSAEIWKTILTIKKENASPITEFFLFLAARHELIHKEALVDGMDVIIFDRFIFSTIAYQLTHQPHYWAPFLTTHRIFSGLMPDLCIYCDVDFQTFQLRNQNRSESQQDTFDQMTQKRFEAIQQAYQQAFQLKICPYLEHKQQDGDVAELIKDIIAHI
ncbi:MAG: dTMP kinase [Candidatus Cardinium sp.]|uniref:dTMP kinase n=1 Tax=Cardinium endosymbiont of Dermatophagoides farinae TaxID=2597823 RepID=UPI0011839C5A|nr:dTMP kinase [Cardinium endosymbiont of Dermatophagoides farinae]TSJ81410.1 dTMP kinase [Cardinium endosymbiont of Dermatophagoides farinae]UWW97472.1 MAG: dTMP kinase [Candidatus Cardinium sp.]